MHVAKRSPFCPRSLQFQLLGACAIFLASKMVEPTPIPACTLVRYTADTYDREELLVSHVEMRFILNIRYFFSLASDTAVS